MAEVGSVEQVIKAPQHPYTRLLVSSIPLPDPDQHWGGETDLDRKAAGGERASQGHAGVQVRQSLPVRDVPRCHRSAPAAVPNQ